MKRNFAEWLLTFTDSIANYKYYIDFETIYKNAEIYKIELNMLNSFRSYKMIAEEAKSVVGFEFVWFTDGMGWISARNNLRETFDNMEHIYNIADMKNGIMKEMFK